jgi:hypothetical protein
MDEPGIRLATGLLVIPRVTPLPGPLRAAGPTTAAG